ncbi:aspartate kinase [Candidatus Saccharibacteria bacterium]|nr:aspartate kinase [Candidatus Saccharibacteria bacterium]
MVVMKFGGTSVGSAERIRDVATIVRDASKTYQVVVVVSAMSGVTDLLVQAAEHAEQRAQKSFRDIVDTIRHKHIAAIESLKLDADTATSLRANVTKDLDELSGWLEGVYMLRELTPRARDLITSFGERLSVQLVAASLVQHGVAAEPVTANRCIVTDDKFGDTQPDLKASAKKTKRTLSPLLAELVTPVVTGFMGATTKGIVTTLGRGGSDYSATILGYCLDAHEVWIWTDVTGVMTADPRIIPKARTIDHLSYDEAAELSYFGAKVLHPFTMLPAALKQTPIVIKNTLEPQAVGTHITELATPDSHEVKAITSMKQLSLITVQGKGMTGVPGFAARVFGALAVAKVSVLFISQASSQYNISLVVKRADGKHATDALHEEFRRDLSRHSIEMVKLRENLAIIAVVGEGMHGHPGVAGKTLSSLGESNINIVAIAQGSSERNISLVIDETDVPAAVRHIHDAFKLERDPKA